MAVFCVFATCSRPAKEPDPSANAREADSIAEARIDSAYKAITDSCNSRMRWLLPQMIKAANKRDSVSLTALLDSPIYTDQDKKVEKIIRQLKADCDSSLLKETYKKARHLRGKVPQPSRPGKA